MQRQLHPVLTGGPLLIGHRGAAGHSPENTLASMREAVEQWGVDMIEFDVHASADGHCVVIHDPTVERTTDGTGFVADMTLAELRELDAGYRFAPERGFPFRGRGLRIPTIDEVFESFPIRWTAEVKVGTAQAPLFDAIRRHGMRDRFIAAGMLDRDRTQFTGYDGARSGSMSTVRRFYALQRMRCLWAWRGMAEVFQVPEFWWRRRVVTPRFIRDASSLGIPVHVWTVNEPADMERLLEWGVDGLITDFPDRVARVLAERVGRPLPPGLAE